MFGEELFTLECVGHDGYLCKVGRFWIFSAKVPRAALQVDIVKVSFSAPDEHRDSNLEHVSQVEMWEMKESIAWVRSSIGVIPGLHQG